MIDFANSSPRTYGGSTEDVMNELNDYFRSYINNGTSFESSNDVSALGSKEDFDGNMDDILHKDKHENDLGFDDALESINRNEKSAPFDADMYEEAEAALLDTDILDKHIDKASLGLSGGNDALRAIENMEGGACGRRRPKKEERGDGSFGLNMIGDDGDGMLGGRKRGELRCNDGPMQGYSGVRHETRKMGKTFRETDRRASNYINEDGVVDFNMVGGSFEDIYANAEGDGKGNGKGDREDNTSETDVDNEKPADDNGILDPRDIERESDSAEAGAGDEQDQSESDSEQDSSEADDVELKRDSMEVHRSDYVMASEIDRVLAQLRSKTGRTLTGGTIPIRKKVVLSDMYPYILRS